MAALLPFDGRLSPSVQRSQANLIIPLFYLNDLF
jgi:hypothetical protein